MTGRIHATSTGHPQPKLAANFQGLLKQKNCATLHLHRFRGELSDAPTSRSKRKGKGKGSGTWRGVCEWVHQAKT